MTARRVGWAMVAVLVSLLVAAPASQGTFAGRNGVLLVSGPGGSSSSAAGGPRAHRADCYGPSGLWMVRPDGSHWKALGVGDTGGFSPGGKRLWINYAGDPCLDYPNSESSDPAAGLYVERVNGTHRQRLMLGPHHAAGGSAPNWRAAQPTWEPNGRLLLSSSSAHPRGLQIVNALTGREIMRIGLSANIDNWDVSCSGEVALVSSVAGRSELEIFTAEREIIRNRSVEVSVDGRVVAAARDPSRDNDAFANVTWSPDGRTVLFERVRTGFDRYSQFGGLWRVGADGRGLRRVTNAPHSEDTGVWSPDGRRILVERDVRLRGDEDLYRSVVVNADGSRPRRIAGDFFYGAVWSPDSRWVAQVASEQHNLVLTNPTSGKVTKRRGAFASDQLLDWQPLPGGHTVPCTSWAPARIAATATPGPRS